MSGILQSLSASRYAPPGGIALVQSASGTTADGSAGLTVNFGVPVTAGNSVIALLSWDGGGLSVNPAIVGGGGGAMAEQVGESPSFRIRICSLHNVASGVTGVTYTSAAVRASMTILEVSGLADAPATDTDTNTGTGTLASLTGLTGTGACFAIFAVENATDPFVGLASNVNVTGIGAGDYELRGEVAVHPYYNLAGLPNDPDTSSILFSAGVWKIVDAEQSEINESSDSPDYPYEASWTGSVVTESPSDWTLVTIPPVGGSNVWQCVAWKDGAASPVSVELTASLLFAAAGVVFEAA